PQAMEPSCTSISSRRPFSSKRIASRVWPPAWGQLQHQRPQQANLWRRLQRMGLPAELSKPLLERVLLDAGGVLALVGPAGAGKTTTLAKMAA
ncbi:flagellar biosynthesis protein FlhF, partial [Pseudomonas aeruginosa]